MRGRPLAYFIRHGLPAQLADLAGHACLLHRFPATGLLEKWPLRRAPARTSKSG
ncbi:hypothetical protein [Massilia sp. BJB1822]|uniref:hypothetical protein n=1 Tax=Massilia sp. BJB1822 TaxID=2744470 RepID=UPI001594451B|nr:hypothetical protein [Massilia sp. BJB1822]